MRIDMSANLGAAAVAALLFLSMVSSAALGDAVLSGAWIRAMPASQTMTAAYLTLDNTGNSAISVVAATSSASPNVEIHTTVSRDGMQRMQRVHTVDVPAGASLDMAPGGYHLMLRDMPDMPAEDDSVELCLELSEGAPVCVMAAVSRVAPNAAGHRH